MSYYVIRNYTVEHLFGIDAEYSHYNSINPEEINASKHEIAICFLLPPVAGNYEDTVKGMQTLIQTLNLLISKVRKRLFLFTIPHFDGYRPLSDNRLSSLINAYNDICYANSSSPNIVCLDFSKFAQEIHPKDFTDWKHFYTSQIALNPKFSRDFLWWFEKQLNTVHSKRKKCIVLDLDNTLWGGVIGEDGMAGIKLGESYPGNVYEDTQRLLLAAYESGTILAICSKNNEADAMQVITEHPNMVLREKHFAIKRINWNNKADNVKNIAETLNIGIDSLVFIDDNPSERALIKHFLPEVEVPNFPDKPYLIPAFINDVLNEYFSIYRLTDEDRKKTEQYEQIAIREGFKESFSDYQQYLYELEMKLELSVASSTDIPRVAQLTQKTNQFNLTTKRYTEDDIHRYMQKEELVYIARVKDKFGEYGLTGVCICLISNQVAEIDTLLMSCRVIGREVENEYINQIVIHLKNMGIKTITASYTRTKRNTIVSSFYEKAGFKVVESAEHVELYKLDVKSYKEKKESVIEVIWKNEKQD